MICTVTFNPAVDYVVHVDELTPGTICRAKSESIHFGGKGINVSLILRELGIESVATGFIAGFTGRAVADGIDGGGIKSDFVELESGCTRINVKLRSGCETDINGQGPSIGKADLEKLLEKLSVLGDGDLLVLAGSVPDSLPDDIYERIMESLFGRGVKFVVDATGGLLKSCLKFSPWLIKPNNDELGELFSTKIDTQEEAAVYAEKLLDLGAQNVLVSMGGKGAVLVDSSRRTYFTEAISGKVVNTVGAGDSMVAGFIAGFKNTGDFDCALALGSAAGSATAFSEGLAKGDDIMKLFRKN